MKLEVRKMQLQKDIVIGLKLIQAGESIQLVAYEHLEDSEDNYWRLMEFRTDGTFKREVAVPTSLGFKLNIDGKIKESK